MAVVSLLLPVAIISVAATSVAARPAAAATKADTNGPSAVPADSRSKPVAPVTADPNGKSLSGKSVADVADDDGGLRQSWLDAVSCPTSDFCAAVGFYGFDGLSEFWNGADWYSEPIPVPALMGGYEAVDTLIQGVSCTSATFCVAVGGYTESQIAPPPDKAPYVYEFAFADLWNGTTWTLSTPPAGNSSDLSAVSCTSPDQCLAVGLNAKIVARDGDSSSPEPLGELWGGSGWSESLDPVSSGFGGFKSVSCTATNGFTCMAVGSQAPSDSDNVAAVFEGSGFSDTDAQNQSQYSNGLWAVDCTSDTACTAVGDSSAPYGSGYVATAEDWNGSDWTISQPSSGDAPDSYLQSIWCQAASNCSAVGWLFDGGVYLNAIQTETPGSPPSWAIGPLPEGPETDFDQMYGIACAPTMKPCMAVGASANADGVYVPVIDQLVATGWVSDAPPQPPPYVDPNPKQNPAGGNPSEPQVCRDESTGGDPCSTADGAFYQNETDLSLAGRDPIAFTRSYSTVLAGVDGPLGYGWSFDFGAGLIVPSQIKNGSTVTFSQENGAQTTFTDKGGSWTAAPQVVATLTHGGNGLWTVVRDGSETFQFGSTGQLLSETNPNGQGLTYTYTSGDLTKVTDSAGRTLTLGWTGTHITSVTDANVTPKRVVSFAYSSAGNLTSVTGPDGGHTDYTYSSAHRMTVFKDPLCSATTGCPGTTIQYNSAGQVSSQTDPLGGTTSFSYSGNNFSGKGGTTTVTQPSGDVTADTYTFGLLVSQTKGYGTADTATWTYRYDPGTLAMLEDVDPDGNTTTMSYDQYGNLISKTDPLGNTTTWTYNTFNEPTSLTDALGVTTTDTYDADGNLTEVQTPCSGCNQSGTQTTTDTVCESATCTVGSATFAEGDVESMTDPDGDTWTYTYDAYGDRTSSTDPTGDRSSETSNADGWLVTSTSADGHVAGCRCTAKYTTTYSYVIKATGHADGLGRIQSVTDPMGNTTSYTYDPDGNRTSVTDAEGATTGYVYDLDSEQTEVQRPDGTTLTTGYNPDGTVAYDNNGAGNAVETYTYNSLDQMASIADAKGDTTRYTYDGVGDLLSKAAPGGNCDAPPYPDCTSYTYDGDGHLTSITYSKGSTPSVNYIDYDADGQRVGESDGSGTWSWSYNALHQLTSVTEGSSGTIGYTYDPRGSVLTTTYPDGNEATDTYTADGRMSSVADWLGHESTFGYDAAGNLTKEELGTKSGVVDSSTYNPDDQMVSTTAHKGSTTLFSADYGRNPLGLVSSDTSQPAAQDSYGYTNLGQLCYAGSTTSGTCADPSSGAATYSYDSADDATSNAGTTQSFNAADQLCWSVSDSASGSCDDAPTGATTYTYNPDGELDAATPASGSASTYDFDQADVLAAYHQGATSVTYGYSGDGLLLSETIGKTTTVLTWNLTTSQPALASDGYTDYVSGPDGATLEQISAKTALWYTHDQLGSTRQLTNAAGQVVASYVYSPSGVVKATTGTATNPVRYAGALFDHNSGLYYMQARWYDPNTGQFLSVDPDVSKTRAPYAYANDDPVNLTDPSGDSSSSKNMQACEQYENSLNPVARDTQELFLLGSDPCVDAQGAIYLNQTVVVPVAQDVQPVTDTIGTVCGVLDFAVIADEVTGPCSIAATGIDADVDMSEDLAGCPVSLTSTALGAATTLAGEPDISSLQSLSDYAGNAESIYGTAQDFSGGSSCSC